MFSPRRIASRLNGCLALAAFASLAANRADAQQPASAPAAPRWAVTGQTLLASGAGAADVEVQVESGGSEKEPGTLVGKATSGKMGEFRVELPGKPADTLHVRAVRAGFSTSYAEVEFDVDDPEAFVSIEMAGALVLRGTVLRASDRRPVAGANVELALFARQWEKTTDEKGRFEFDGVTADAATLVVRAPKLAYRKESLRIGDGGDVEIRLEPARPVRLQVVNDHGAALAGVQVQARTPVAAASLTTDERGRADVPGVGSDDPSVSLSASHPDHVFEAGDTGELVIQLPRTGTQPTTSPFVHKLVLRRAGRIAGIIVSHDRSEPISSARAMVGPEFTYGMPTAWSDAEGRFELGSIAPGTAVITIHHADYAPCLVETKVEVGQTAQVKITLEPGQPISGTVVDEDGKPVANAVVAATRWRNYDTIGLRTLSDDKGAFALEHVPDGPIDFRVADAKTRASESLILRAGRTDCRVTLKRSAAPPPTSAPTSAGVLAVGQPVPRVAVTTLDGTLRQLSAIKGKYVFVDFWATWCGPCVAEMPALKQVYADLKDRDDFVMIGVSLDADPATVKAFVQKQGIGWAIAAGGDSNAQAAARALGVQYIPFNFLIGPDGKVLAVEIHGDLAADRLKAIIEKDAGKR